MYSCISRIFIGFIIFSLVRITVIHSLGERQTAEVYCKKLNLFRVRIISKWSKAHLNLTLASQSSLSKTKTKLSLFSSFENKTNSYVNSTFVLLQEPMFYCLLQIRINCFLYTVRCFLLHLM